MKTRLLYLLLAAFVMLPLSARTYCVFAAVSNYKNEKANLQVSTDDAKRMTKLYRDHGAKVRLLTSSRATSDSILFYIREIARRSKPEDQVVFFFSGHGTDNQMITYDMDQRLPYDVLFDELRKIDCSKIVIYIDACFSGSMRAVKSSANDSIEFNNGSLQRNVGNNEKFILFSSSRNDEVSFESAYVKGGFFTNALIKGLTGAADANGDQDITTEELFRYIHRDVGKQLGKDYKQHPTLTTNLEKNLNVVLMSNK